MNVVFGPPEWISLIFFLFFSGLAWVRPLDWERRLKIMGLGAAGIALLLLPLPFGRYGHAFQRFAPLALMPLAYWQTGQFSAPINERFQAILAAIDRKILVALEKTGLAVRNPRRLNAFFE